MGNQQSELYGGAGADTVSAAAGTLRCAFDGAESRQADSVLGYTTPSLRDHFTVGRKLGEGEFGTVYQCIEKSTGMAYACKTIPKSKFVSPADVEDLRREIEILHRLSGRADVVEIKGAFEDSLFVHIVMELCNGGELYDRVLLRTRYSEKKAATVAKTIVEFVMACHDLGIMHRDLKLENFLLVDKEDDVSIKAIDFGLSVYFKPGQVFRELVGSPHFIAPEVVNRRYGPEADVWSVGVILYMLLSGLPPFYADTRDGIFDAILDGHIDLCSDPWPSVSDDAKDLVGRMLRPDPSERLTLRQVLCHPWFSANVNSSDHDPDIFALTEIGGGLHQMFSAKIFDELKESPRKFDSPLVDVGILMEC